MLLISFSLFPTFSLRQMTTNIQASLLTSKCSLFASENCLPSFGMFEWFSSNGRSYWNLVEGCSSFRRYFNQIYWEKMPTKVIITSAKSSTFPIFAQYLPRQNFWKFSRNSSWRFLSKGNKAWSRCESQEDR